MEWTPPAIKVPTLPIRPGMPRKEESALQNTSIAVDRAKSVFEIAISHRPGVVAERRRLSRKQFAALPREPRARRRRHGGLRHGSLPMSSIRPPGGQRVRVLEARTGRGSPILDSLVHTKRAIPPKWARRCRRGPTTATTWSTRTPESRPVRHRWHRQRLRRNPGRPVQRCMTRSNRRSSQARSAMWLANPIAR